MSADSLELDVPDAAMDNDVLIKAACYGLLAAFKASRSVGVLGAARYVVPSRISRQALNGSAEAARRAALDFIADNVELEPSHGELQLAVAIEQAAQRLGLELDAGESQLAALVVLRGIELLETGDKRAIKSLDALLEELPEIGDLCGRVRCLEQIIAGCVATAGQQVVGEAICNEPQVDKTLSICFRCFAPAPHWAQLDPAGLESYIATLRNAASSVLAA